MRGAFITVPLLLLAGCGGGGVAGNSGRNLGDTCPGNPQGTITYSTTWGSTPSGASQVIQLRDAAGNLLRPDTLNRQGASSSSLPPISFGAGVYELKVTLYPQPNATGTPLGETSVVVDLCGGTPVDAQITTAAGVAVKTLTLNPISLRLNQQQTRRFVATPRTNQGVPGFLPVGSVHWSVLGGIGTINSTGVFTASTPGSGSVVGNVTSPPLNSSSPVTVDAFNPAHGKWTVLVFMNAANDLAPDSDLNMNQMEQVAGNPNVRFVVQWKESHAAFAGSTFEGVRRYLVKPDTDPNTINSELVQDNLVDGQGNALDMGNPQTLLDFITWGKQFYPADRYVLVLWNHGKGWQRSPNGGDRTRGFSFDDQYGTHIDTWQLSQALGSNTFDIVAWDASLMQMMEVNYELRGKAGFVAGSEESPPEQGYPYQDVFKAFRDTPDAPTATLSKGFVDGMLNNPLYAGLKITQSVIDTSKLNALASALDSLGTELFNNKGTMGTIINQVRNNAQSYSPNSLRYYRDIGDVCKLLKADAGTPASVKTAATAVETALAAAVVWEGHNSHSPNSNGLAIDFSPGGTFQSYRADYLQLKFAQDTFWDEFLGAAP
ncbi:MAG: hypothetical protein JSS66_11165 [Armatimonadetes bacterium]|nr:hypothetical protein [Armatimonadota bacterium]